MPSGRGRGRITHLIKREDWAFWGCRLPPGPAAGSLLPCQAHDLCRRLSPGPQTPTRLLPRGPARAAGFKARESRVEVWERPARAAGGTGKRPGRACGRHPVSPR